MEFSLLLCLITFLMGLLMLYYETAYSLENTCVNQNKVEINEEVGEKSVDLKQVTNGTGYNQSELRTIEIHKEPGMEGAIKSEQLIRERENFSDTPIYASNSPESSPLSSPVAKIKWKGLNSFSAADCITMRPINPPDVTIGVSKNHVAQMVHNSIQVWDKSGNPLVKESLYDFFNVSRENYLTDPEIIYDNTSGNWFSTIVDGGTEVRTENNYSSWSCKPAGCSVILVKSSNDNPIQNRSILRINASSPDFFPDQPKVAVNKFNLLVTTSEFNITNEAETLSFAYMIDKEFRNIFDALPWDVKPWGSSQHFALQVSSPSNCTYSAALVKEDRLAIDSNVSLIQIAEYCDNTDIATLFGPYPVPLPSESKLVPAPKFKQPINQPLVNEIDLAISSGIHNGQSAWITLHAACQPVSISDHSCVRILKFDRIPAEDKYILAENTQFHINDTDVYYPAIGITRDGKVFFISGFSNSSTFPSLAVSQLKSENQTMVVYRIFGSDINNSTRYGDYFGSAIDPIDGSVWLSGEYVDGSLSIPVPTEFEDIPNVRENTWSTIIANVS